MPQTTAAALVETLARAVQHAHDRGVVHRDLKPVNVLIAADGTPKVTDFGLAKLTDADASGRTHTGAVMGTPAYMSPEQAAGKTRLVGPAADTYALGVILYELLTGRVPFVGKSLMHTLHKVMAGNPKRPSRVRPEVDADIEWICLRAMATRPADRHESAAALADELVQYLAGLPVRPQCDHPDSERPTRRKMSSLRNYAERMSWKAAFLLLLALCLFLGLAVVAAFTVVLRAVSR